MGFRRFHLRGLAKAAAEWTLVALAYNCRRMTRLQTHQLRSACNTGPRSDLTNNNESDRLLGRQAARCLGDVRGDRIHQGRGQAVVGFEIEFLQAAADARHPIRSDALLDDG